MVLSKARGAVDPALRGPSTAAHCDFRQSGLTSSGPQSSGGHRFWSSIGGSRHADGPPVPLVRREHPPHARAAVTPRPGAACASPLGVAAVAAGHERLPRARRPPRTAAASRHPKTSSCTSRETVVPCSWVTRPGAVRGACVPRPRAWAHRGHLEQARVPARRSAAAWERDPARCASACARARRPRGTRSGARPGPSYSGCAAAVTRSVLPGRRVALRASAVPRASRRYRAGTDADEADSCELA